MISSSDLVRDSSTVIYLIVFIKLDPSHTANRLVRRVQRHGHLIILTRPFSSFSLSSLYDGEVSLLCIVVKTKKKKKANQIDIVARPL